MLATTFFSPFASSQSPPHPYLPTIPSPLSPRSANIYGPARRFASMSSDSAPSAKDPAIASGDENGGKNHVPFSRRAVKKAPSPHPDELKERRRNLFLKKVREEREDRRFEARGDDIMRLDFVQRRKQWEAQLAREAPALHSDSVGEDDDEKEDGDDEGQPWYELPSSNNAMQMSAPSTQQLPLEEEVDQLLQREREELEALLSFMPEEVQEREDDNKSDHLYSDDDDYDALFSELMQQDYMRDSGAHVPAQDQGEAMDMS